MLQVTPGTPKNWSVLRLCSGTGTQRGQYSRKICDSENNCTLYSQLDTSTLQPKGSCRNRSVSHVSNLTKDFLQGHLITTSKWHDVKRGPQIQSTQGGTRTSLQHVFAKVSYSSWLSFHNSLSSMGPVLASAPSRYKSTFSLASNNRTILSKKPLISHSNGSIKSHRWPACMKTQSSRPIFTKKVDVSLENIFSSENKVRSQRALNTSGIEVKDEECAAPAKSIVIPIHQKSREAAVLVPLCTVNGVPAILFTLRTTRMNNHRGQVSFPGGMKDEDDGSIVDTAIREMEEELGISSSKIDVWGTLPTTSSKNDGSILVTPVVATCGEITEDSLIVNPHEVEEIFFQSIESLCNPEHQGYTRFRTVIKPVYPNGYTLPAFTGGAHRIWGLTAVVLHQTLRAIAPGIYNYRILHGKM
ncbi:uncharacterized protein LOC106169237 [Lingula anatina]|uniref:Uncharacterized protein LOC106169237 n=1 Tax=Lingula anatina TaxID=7574 RepID=A0A1S3J0Y1_LINAN|nr:uncharacterized protein LOC106169237 [Lingula anatina]|eukprot:XP_013404095.1 uncharacterized protein LOC106169237 [Lingula anatina]